MNTTFPALTTSRLQLRAFEAADVANIFKTYSEPAVTQYYDLETMREESEAERITTIFRERFGKGIGIRWAIELKDGGAYIGDCGFNPWDKRNAKSAIGYALLPAFWGKGYAFEAVQAILKFGFSDQNPIRLNRAEAHIDPANQRSIALALKLGFTYEGTLRKNVLEKGEFKDTSIYGLLRGEPIAT